MSVEPPEYYFWIRENGAVVFHVNTENRQRRIDMDQIAVVNFNKQEIKPHGSRELSAEDLAAIDAWVEKRIALLKARTLDDIHSAADHLNETTQWAQSKASDEESAEITDTLLMTMNDLRTVLVRKKADQVMKAQAKSDS